MTMPVVRSVRPPGPAGSYLWSIRRALKDPLKFLLDMGSYGDVVTIRPDKTFVINSPDDIKRVLQDNHFNYRKGERYIRALEPLFGRGLLISEGDLWRRQRRAIQPAFYRAHHPDYARAIVDTTHDWLGRWEDAARAGTPLDLRKQLMDLALAVLMKTIFGRSSGKDIEAVGQAFRMAHREMNLVAAFMPVRLPKWIPRPVAHGSRVPLASSMTSSPGSSVNGDAAARTAATSSHCCSRRETRTRGSDVVAADSRRGRRDVVGGTRYSHRGALLDDVPGRAAPRGGAARYQEATSALGERNPVAEDVKALAYTVSVVEEAMRIYPPVWGMMRTATAADVLGGYAIPAGARVLISPYVVHHSPSIWPEPERFDPDWFSPERAAGRHRFAYFPFGAGPRLCVGAQFAMLEVPLVAAMLWRRFVIRLVPGQRVRPLARIMSQPTAPSGCRWPSAGAEPGGRMDNIIQLEGVSKRTNGATNRVYLCGATRVRFSY